MAKRKKTIETKKAHTRITRGNAPSPYVLYIPDENIQRTNLVMIATIKINDALNDFARAHLTSNTPLKLDVGTLDFVLRALSENDGINIINIMLDRKNGEIVAIEYDEEKNVEAGTLSVSAFFVEDHPDPIKGWYIKKNFQNSRRQSKIGGVRSNLEKLVSKDNLEDTTKGQRLRLKGGRLIRTQVSLVPMLKQALESAASAENTSASLIINELLENDPRIQQFLNPEKK